ncbi:SsgA family sporulation/cell division regulator [Streptomyces sp. NPDC002577]
MHNTLEQPARAGLITPDDQVVPVSVTLRYNSADPLAVQIEFPTDVSLDGRRVTWTFARALLEEGLGAPAGVGDVHIWPCGRFRTVVEFRVPQGLAVMRFSTRALHRFLLRSYAVVEPGAENLGSALDQGLASLLDGV